MKVLALDLEATLISDASTAIARPGLYEFLEFCRVTFERVVLFTTVESTDARGVLESLAKKGEVPFALLDRLEYIDWNGEFKDLRFIKGASPDEIILADDDEGWIHPDQENQWIPVAPFYGDPDDELSRLRREIERSIHT